MCPADIAPRFDHAIVFPDVDAATLAREENNPSLTRAIQNQNGAWQDYLRKVLPPTTRHTHPGMLRIVRI
jgi:hypothetical protein